VLSYTKMNTTNVEADLPSTKVDLTKLSHLTTDEERQFVSVLDDFSDVFVGKPDLCEVGSSVRLIVSFGPYSRSCSQSENFVTRTWMIWPRIQQIGDLI